MDHDDEAYAALLARRGARLTIVAPPNPPQRVDTAPPFVDPPLADDWEENLTAEPEFQAEGWPAT